MKKLLTILPIILSSLVALTACERVNISETTELEDGGLYILDTDQDGVEDAIFYDLNGNGRADIAFYDVNEDNKVNKLDAVIILRDSGASEEDVASFLWSYNVPSL